jgi:WD40 repeat protein
MSRLSRVAFVLGTAGALCVSRARVAAQTSTLATFTPAGGGGISCLDYSADGRYLATSSFSGFANVYTSGGKHVGSLYTPDEAAKLIKIFHIRFDGATSRVGTANYDGTVGIARADGTNLTKHFVDSASITDVAFTRSLPGIFATADNGALQYIQPNGVKKWTVVRDGVARNLAISPDEKILAFTSDPGDVWLVDLDGRVVGHIPTGQGRLDSVRFHPRLPRVITAGRSGTALLWTYDGSRVATFRAPGDPWMFGATFTPDGERVCTIDRQGVLNIVKAATGETIASHRVPGAVFSAVACSPTMQRVAVGDQRGIVNIFSLPA